MLFTHTGQMNSSVEDLLRLPVKNNTDQNYVYPIQIDMQITCPPQRDGKLIEQAKNFYYNIPDNILTDIKNNKCKLLFDFTSESYDITYRYFGNRDYTHQIIINTMNKYKLIKNDVILIVGNVKPYEPNEYHVVSLPYQIFMPLCQPEDVIDKQYEIIKNKTQRPKKLLTFMGKPYKHRAEFCKFIFNNNFHETNLVTCYTPFKDMSIHNFKDELNLSDDFLNSLPWIYDLHDIDSSDPFLPRLKSDMERQAFLDTYIHFVSETYFEHTSNNYNNYELDMTDKCTKAIVMGSPFILHAQPGALQYLKDCGFKTFDKWWDESYDLEKDHTTRKNKLYNLYQKLSNTSHKELSQMIYEMFNILKFNRNHYNEYKDNSKHYVKLYKKLNNMFL